MTLDAWITIAIVGGMLLTLMSSRYAPVAVIGGALCALILLGIAEPDEGLSGFSNQGLITIALLFVVVAGVVDTGAVHALGGSLLGRPRSATAAQLRLMPPVTIFSAFLNNTPLVAMMIPVVEDWCRRCHISPSKLMIPLSYAAILGGTCTIIGTSTNLVVQGMVQTRTDLGGMGFFEIGKLGLPTSVLGISLVVILGRWLLPERKPPLSMSGDTREYVIEMLVQAGSGLTGRSVEQAGLRHLPGAFLIEMERGGILLPAVPPETVLQAGDRLIFAGAVDSMADILKMRGLIPAPDQVFKLDEPRAERRVVEAVVAEGSPLEGRSIRDSEFRTRYDAVVIAVARNGERLHGKVGDIELRAGDILLMETRPAFSSQQRGSRDFLMISELSHAKLPRHEKAWLALAILVAMVACATLELVSMLEASMGAALLMIATGCTKLDSVRASMDWNLLLMIGAALGIGSALASTGAAAALANAWLELAGDSPWLALLAVYATTSILTEVITNNAAAALMFPIAQAAAESLGVSFWPFIACIMMAASASFLTPIGYQTNLMVYGPGGYRFSDFLRIGIVMNLSLGTLAVVLAPMIWPFYPAP